MRPLRPCSLLLLLGACASPAHIIATDANFAVPIGEVADDVAKADVVALGELHRTPAVHAVHHELLAELHARRPDLVIAMEMFERDTQTVLLQYLSGLVDEATFLAAARPWPRYQTDYRPVVEFAKANGLVVLAANAPIALVRRVGKEGIAAVAGEMYMPRETTAPEDDYWDAFVDAMKGHPGTTPETMQRQYAAQCLRDDSMAESITDHLRAEQERGRRPLVVLLCGRMHSDHGRGTVARIKSRMPGLDVRVLSAETVADLSSGPLASPRSVGSYVVVAEQEPARDPELTKPGVVVAKDEPARPPVTVPTAASTPATPPKPPAEGENAGMAPALGFKPGNYEEGGGILVESVTEGGPAANAGIEDGDIILKVAGTEIDGFRDYMQVLGSLTIGKTVPVVVRRANAEVELQVKVGSRPSSR
jgi:uncharacterized iron-regulated protein